MCGIVGYVGEGHAKERIIDGLKRLEYRGYDSAGIALPINGRIEIRKHVGEIKNLEKIIGDPTYDSFSRDRSHQMGDSWRSVRSQCTSPCEWGQFDRNST